MSSVVTLRLPDDMLKTLDKISRTADRTRTYIVKKALGRYLAEYADYQVALDRLRNKDDKIISSEALRKSLGI